MVMVDIISLGSSVLSDDGISQKTYFYLSVIAGLSRGF